MKTVIVIPALNEAATIDDVVAGVAAHGAPLVVDDGSTDDTAEKAEAAGAEVVRLEANRGYEAALEAGFARAATMGADVIATFEADGQVASEVLNDVLHPLTEGRADLVIGVRPAPARASEFLFSLYTRWRYSVSDILCGVKAYRATLYRRHGRFDKGWSVGTELALAALREGARIATVPVPVRPRISGRSRYGLALRANLRILRAMAGAVGNDLALSLGSSQQKKQCRFVDKRRALVARYDELLAPLAPVVRPVGRLPVFQATWHPYAVRVDFKAAGLTQPALMSRLHEQGIYTKVYRVPVYQQPYFGSRYIRKWSPRAEAYEARAISLPLHAGMSEADVERVVGGLRQVLEGGAP
ncbi:MAG: DegT/DnrJ/EryC1/StrS family aminotransferase [Alphaproteobacteria bacterium]|nr:DegT/DnrJ/EryC1/StrS family aminotransferase [Alphaproteobacteria bacterium]